MKTKISILIVVLGLALVSCIKNEIVINTDEYVYRTVEFAGPLAKVHIPLFEAMDKYIDLGESGSFGFDDKGVIYFKYSHSESIEWNNEISIDNTYYKTFELDLSGMDIINNTFTIDYPVKLTTGTPDSYVNKAELSGGDLIISLSVPASCDIKLTIPGLTKDNEPFSESFKIQNPPGKFTISKMDFLNGYKMQTDDNHFLIVKCVIAFEGSTLPTGYVTIGYTLENTKITYLSGYFGEIVKPVKSVKMFDIFDELNFEGSIKGVKVETKVKNGTGIPVNIKTNSIKFGIEDNLLNSFELYIPAATEGANHQVFPATASTEPVMLSDINFNKGNYPTEVKYDIVSAINPNGLENENFIVQNGENLAEVDFKFTVPLNNVRIDELNRENIIEFDYNKIVGNDENYVNNVQFLNINLSVNNRLPFDIELTADAIGADGESVKQIFKDKKINNKAETAISVALEKGDLENFSKKDVKHIILTTRTKTSGYVEVKKGDYLDIDVSVRFKSNIPNNIFHK